LTPILLNIVCKNPKTQTTIPMQIVIGMINGAFLAGGGK